MSVTQAKERLRVRARAASLTRLTLRRPWEALGIAFAAGLLAGSEPQARRVLAEGLAQVLSRGLVDSLDTSGE